VGEFPVEAARAIGFIVTATPTGDVPIDCAHASVDWPPAEVPPGSRRPPKQARRRLRDELAKSMSWVHGRPTVKRQDGY
jgi:hypothetical protein